MSLELNIIQGLIIAFPSFAVGVGMTIAAARKGQVSDATCSTCKTSLTNSIAAVIQDTGEIRKDLSHVFERQDETNRHLSELVGYIKGSKGQGL